MTGRVGEHDQHVLANDGEVEGIAAGLRGRPRHAVEVVAGDHRHRGRQRAHLHESRRFELAAQLFAFDHRFRHARPLDRDGALRRQYRSKRFVVGVEDAVDLVQHLHGAHEDVLVIDQGQREHAAGAIAGGAVDLGIEAFVGVAIRDVEDPAFTRARTDETGTCRNAHRCDAGRDPQHHLVRGGVVEPHGRALRTQDVLGGVDDFRQHGHEVEGCGELARHGEDELDVVDGKPVQVQTAGTWRRRI